MEINLKDAIGNCYSNRNVFCMILTPLTFASTAAVPVIIFIELILNKLTVYHAKSLVFKLNMFLHFDLLLIGITIISKYLSSKIINVTTQNDTIALAIGIALTVFFTILSIAELLKLYSELSLLWKIIRIALLSISYLWLIICVLAGPNMPFLDGSLLVFLALCTVLTGASVIHCAVYESRALLSFKLLLSMSVALGLWIGLLITVMFAERIELRMNAFPMALVMCLGFVLQTVYCVSYFLVSDEESLIDQSIQRLSSDHKFGANVQDFSEAIDDKS
eukprot:TRINITY_DN10761_c0_g2_i1.p1 TRINITY_DN10761_c0_g2~~TRINITY_DN10761_c0_g2_i1.p1  ORF type:complete len:277 (-),score=46.02 TRINITY_DN10761_c0_g2_i1:78-908(-)